MAANRQITQLGLLNSLLRRFNLKNIREIERNIQQLNNDEATLPARDADGDLRFTLNTLWSRLIYKLEGFFISGDNVLTAQADTEGHYEPNSSINDALSTKASKAALSEHTNSNYISSDPHLILTNKSQFRRDIDVYSKSEVNNAISNVKTFRFIGYFGSVDPSTLPNVSLNDGDLWSDNEDFLSIAPLAPIDVLRWNEMTNEWEEGWEDEEDTFYHYTYPNAESWMDAWYNTDNRTIWYWFNGWEHMDATGDNITIGVNAQGKLEIKDNSITQVKFAEDVISNQMVQEWDLSSEVNGNKTTFTVPWSLSGLSVSVFLNGVRLVKGTEYSKVIDDIVIIPAPEAGSSLVVMTQGFVPSTAGVNKFYFSSPDYINRENINRITAIGQSWTVDRDGYVYLLVMKSREAGPAVRFFINDTSIFWGDCANDASITAVSKGDVVELRSEAGATMLGSYCLFIPPKYNEIPAPIVEPGRDYSLTEMPVLINDNGNVRQKKDINGDLIYRRTFTGTITAEINTPNNTVLEENTAIEAIINVEGWWGRMTDNVANTLKRVSVVGSFSSAAVSSGVGINYINASQNNLMLISVSNRARTNAPYEVTVTYTKRS